VARAATSVASGTRAATTDRRPITPTLKRPATEPRARPL
jgi:hypothetical protein